MFILFKCGYNLTMNKKEYINCLENLIINRVKYHAPLVKENFDYAVLDAYGIDASYPIFVFDKPLDKIYFKAFLNAKKRAEFNLILLQKPIYKSRKIKSMLKTYFIYKDEIGSNLSNSIEQLNINYLTHSDFIYQPKGEQILFNGKEIKFDFLPYFYTKKLIDNGVVINAKSFLLNGKNYVIDFSNTTDKPTISTFEFCLPLPRVYYSFKRKDKYITIENLTNKDMAYFNYNIKNVNMDFSTMSGIESCTFACIKLECKINLLPRKIKKIYFNFGDNKYNLLNAREMELFFEISQKKMNEIFDLKVTTKDSNFDQLFNRSLPCKIWEKWNNFDIDEESENQWLIMKKKLIKNDGKTVQISKDFKGLKEVKFFRNCSWKRVFIVHNNACYLFADKIKYYNYTLLTKEIFDKNNEIYLSFAE